MTRKEYLEQYGKAKSDAERTRVHRRYYAQYAEPFIGTVIVRFGLSNLRAAAADEDLASIPLSAWDALADLYLPDGTSTRDLLRVNGDAYSKMTGVCILKEAATLAVERNPA